MRKCVIYANFAAKLKNRLNFNLKEMKKNLFFYLFAVLCTMPLFTSCSDDDEPVVIPVDEEIAGNYGGKLDIKLMGQPISGDGIAQNVSVTKAGDNAISLSIADFSFVGVQVGDINLNNCALTSTGENAYSFTAEPFELASEDGQMTCTVTLNSGSIVNEILTLNLGIDAQLAGMEQSVEVTFTGERGVTVETASSEADITAFSFDTDYEAHPMHQVLIGAAQIDAETHTITFNVDRDSLATEKYADALANLYPIFTLSEKATSTPASGEAMDFSGENNSVVITVTAEDGTTKTEWTVKANLTYVPTALANDFSAWTETTGSVILVSGTWETPEPADVWASANLGCVGLSMLGYQGEMAMMKAEEGEDGMSAMVQTLDTRAYALAPAITPGSLYTGSFNLDVMAAIGGNYLPSTHFGVPFKGKPATLNVTYKYEKGAEYVGGETGTEEDKGLIVAVLYEATDAAGADFHLDGSTLTDTQYHVMSAWVEGAEGVSDTNGEWKTVSIPFEELGTYDSAKSYKLAIVCQSSVNGATAQGAVGSKLWIDNIEVEAVAE